MTLILTVALTLEPTLGLAAALTWDPPSQASDRLFAPAGVIRRDPAMYGSQHRQAVRLLRSAGIAQHVVAESQGCSVRTVRRIEKEPPVRPDPDSLALESQALENRRVGRPSKTEPFMEFIALALAEEPHLMGLELLRRCRERGYDGGKSALYAVVKQLRPSQQRGHCRFEGLPGEFSQHDFGQVDVRFVDGTVKRIRFFASRLKYSRWSQVSLVPDETAETLCRATLSAFEAFGGVPLRAVFDRPKTVAIEWKKDGTITKWNKVFEHASLAIGFVAEVCWPYSPEQKGSVENLVKWVKGSFFKQRRFVDMDDLEAQLAAWHLEVNERRPSRATGVTPAERMAEERLRLRPTGVTSDAFALPVPVVVTPTGYVVHDTHSYSMPPKTAGLPGTIYLHRDRVRVTVGEHRVVHPRLFGKGEQSTLPEHREQQVDAMSGARGKLYVKRQHILDADPVAMAFITELVHRDPDGWGGPIGVLHELLQAHGESAVGLALRSATDVGRIDIEYVKECLSANGGGAYDFGATHSGRRANQDRGVTS